MLVEGNRGLVIAQPSSESDQEGGWIMRHARRIIFQLAEVAVPGGLFSAFWGG